MITNWNALSNGLACDTCLPQVTDVNKLAKELLDVAKQKCGMQGVEQKDAKDGKDGKDGKEVKEDLMTCLVKRYERECKFMGEAAVREHRWKLAGEIAKIDNRIPKYEDNPGFRVFDGIVYWDHDYVVHERGLFFSQLLSPQK
jgi:hypothetical protein